MPPVRIRYHVPVSPAVSVIRYNDPLKDRNRKLPRQNRSHKHNHHRLRDSKSDFDYDYRPTPDDFEHMRKSVPDKYWGPYNPYIYKGRRDWEAEGDDKYYDFKYDSNRRHASEGDYRGEYEPEPPRQQERRYGGRYEVDMLPPPGYRRQDRGFESHRPPHRPDYDRGYQTHRAPNYPDYDRGYDSQRPPHRPDYDRGYFTHRPTHEPGYDGGYRYDRRPVAQSYDRGYDPHYGGRGRYDYHRRPEFVQSEIIFPKNTYRPLPYLGDPNRKPHEHRRRPDEPSTYRSYNYEHRYHPDEHRQYAHYPSPRTEEVDSFTSHFPYPEESPGRLALMKKSHRKHHNGYCEASPEKSSKYIPTMHYDELRCPHCQDKLQSYQNEVLAYPWTVQTFRPKLPISDAHASVITPSILTATVQDGIDNLNNTVVSANKTLATAPVNKTDNNKDKSNKNDIKNDSKNKNNNNNKDPKTAVTEPKNQAEVAKGDQTKPGKRGKENKTENKKNPKIPKADEPKAGKKQEQKTSKAPLSDAGNIPPLFRTDDDVIDGSKVRSRRGAENKPAANAGKRPSQKKPSLETVRESPDENDDTILNFDFNDYDDISPQDSVSNVRLPPLRAYSKGPNNTEHRRLSMARARAETEVTPYSYPSGRYFPRLEYIPPPPAQATPLPKRLGNIEPSRRLQGRYYDRQDGRIYDYDVNYAGRQIFSERRPLR